MSVISMKALLESGVHFGHRTHKWNPAMKPYIFTERNGIHIIDLQKTVKAIEQVYALVRDTVAEGGAVLFVGTKRQAQEMIQNEATRVGMPYVTERWLGGMLTNWRTIRQRINELDRLERMRDSGDFARVTKKEGILASREIERLETLLGGVRHMVRLPDLLFVVDVQREATAIHEANILGIPVIGMVDTNCDPRDVDYVIPSNDDAIRAIKLMVTKIADAVVEGKAMRKDIPEEREDVTVRAVPEERELTDDELLGEATLAKLSGKFGRPEEEEVLEPAAEGEFAEEITVEEELDEPITAEETEEASDLAGADEAEAVSDLTGADEAEAATDLIGADEAEAATDLTGEDEAEESEAEPFEEEAEQG